MNIFIIFNPLANRGKAGRMQPLLTQLFSKQQIHPKWVPTTAPHQATHLAQQIATSGEAEAVVVAGGDGSVNEVVNGLIRAAGEGPTLPLGVIPMGTGNDYSDMCDLPRDPEKAIAVIAAGHTRQLDAGRVNGHYFANACAVAMEPVVTLENLKMKRVRGNLRYLLAMLKGFIIIRAWNMQITVAGDSHEGPTYLLSICNGPRTGGQFLMYPEAKMDDGLFNYVLGPKMPKWEVLTILPRFLSGSHLQHPKIIYGATPFVHITSDPPTPVHTDGEVVFEAESEIHIDLLPGKITLLALD